MRKISYLENISYPSQGSRSPAQGNVLAIHNVKSHSKSGFCQFPSNHGLIQDISSQHIKQVVERHKSISVRMSSSIINHYTRISSKPVVMKTGRNT